MSSAGHRSGRRAASRTAGRRAGNLDAKRRASEQQDASDHLPHASTFHDPGGHVKINEARAQRAAEGRDAEPVANPDATRLIGA